MNEVHSAVKKYERVILDHREWLHSHPELSGEEEKTAAYIATVLREMDLEPQEHIGGYGVSAVIEGSSSGKCVALRADFDALPITESTGLSFSSQFPGIAHACGHDAHTAMLLGAAYVLQELRHCFHGKVKLIFQPSEENALASGAKSMIEDGVLENPHVDAIFGQHVWPQYSVGQIAIRHGAMMAASDRFFITIHGKNSHGSTPESGIDAIAIGAQVISALQTIISRNISPLDSAVITIGTIKGGNRYNVIADTLVMEGTCRTINPDIRNSMPNRIEAVVHGVVEGMGGTYNFEYLCGYSPTVNDNELCNLLSDTIAEIVGVNGLIVPDHPGLGGEDFSFYCEKIPGAYFWLGCREENAPLVPLHHGSFAPKEEVLALGTEVLVSAALKYLSGNQ